MSKTRCANTVPTRVAHAPFRPGIFRVSTATRASSPIRPGRTAFANRPTENAEKTSNSRGYGGPIAEWMTLAQAKEPSGHPSDPADRQPQAAVPFGRRLVRRLHPAIIVGDPVAFRSPHDRE